MTQRIVMIALIIVIVLGGGLYAYKQLVPPQAEESQGPIYSTKEVIRGNISVGVNATGMLNPTRGGGIIVPGERDYSRPPISYVLDEILVEDGDEVTKGQVLARLKSSDLEMQIEDKEEKLKMKREELSDMTGVPAEEVESINPAKGITIKAPIDGKITNLDVTEGDELKLGHAICQIVDDSKFRVRARVPVAEISKVKQGQDVLLSFPYFDGFIKGQVTGVNPYPIPDNEEDSYARGFVHIVTIEGENPGLVQEGMDVRVGLPGDDNNAAVHFITSKAKVEGFKEEKKVINKAEAVVTEVYVHEMEMVKKGDLIVSMAGTDVQETLERKIEEVRELSTELNKLKAQLGQLEITAPMDGVVASIHKQEGETVRTGEWIGDIYNTGEMMLWVQIDDIDIVHVKQDAPVKVTVDAVPGETFEGKVVHISARGDEVKGITKFGVNIRVKGGPQLRPGMQANAYIDAGSAENVLLVPLEAIFEEDGKSMVEILQPDGTVKLAAVKIGLMNDRYAEVTSGVEEGDLVITGSSADLLPSQHIKSKDTLLPDKDNSNDNNGTNPENNN